MPRLSKTPPKYRRHSQGSAFVCINGKRISLGRYDSPESRQKYELEIARWKVEQEQRAEAERAKREAEKAIPKPATLAELRERFKRGDQIMLTEFACAYHERNLEYYRKNGMVTREAEIIREAILALCEQFSTYTVNEIDCVCLMDFREGLIDDRDWSRKYINKQVGRIIRMFKWGTENLIVDPKVTQVLQSLTGLKRGRTRARETEPIKPVEITKVKATIPHLSTIVADMVRLQLLTAARPGEICSLRPCDVNRDGDIWEFRPEEHKTEAFERDRVIYIGPHAQSVLAKYLLRDCKSYCFDPREAVAEMRAKRSLQRSTSMACGNKPGTNVKAIPKRSAGERYSSASYRKAIHRGCKRAFPADKALTGEKLKAWNKRNRWSPNQLRHTKATSIRKEFGLEASQIVLGHSTADITQVYAERDRERALQVVRMIG